MRTILLGAGLCGAALLAAGTPASATVNVAIDLATQRMHVQSSTGSFDWPVSTAREGYVTPTGTFAPERLMEVYHSKKYDNAPMPHAIFFYYGFAIHGTNETKHLGRPASHGCVRLAPANATKLYSMVKAEGATITISGVPPWAPSGYSAAVASNAPASGKGGLFSFLGF
jgi:lipoprotein-anchoring transpeptidase ErfK/SrfK